MYCWGSTENGELGLGGTAEEQVLLPTFNNFGSSWKIKQIAAGLNHTLFLSEDGVVYSCGNNEGGQLGHNKPNRRPEHVDALESYIITQVAAGDQHSLALTSWGTAYAWGENGFGQLGINTTESHIDVPKIIKTLAKKQVIQLCCGAHHSLALTFDNEVYGWGLNTNGQLGLSHRKNPVNEPHCINLLSSIPLRLLGAGGHHSIALTKGGFLLTWGSNKYGQLGRQTADIDSTTNSSSTPELVPNLTTYSEPLKYVAVGENHTAVLDSYGKLWTFGHGRYGQLGHGNFTDSSIPRPVLDLVGSRVSQVACGRCHTLVYIPSQGQLYAFGQGMSGQLGVKSAQNRNLPHTVIGPWRAPSGRSISSVEEPVEGEGDTIFYVKNVFAGGDASFVTSSKERNQGLDLCLICPFDQPAIIEETNVNAMVSLSEEDMIDEDLFTYCEAVMGALGCWNGSFMKEGSSKLDHKVDYRKAEECMEKLGRVSKESLMEIAETGIEKATKELPTKPVSVEGLRGFVILPLWKGFSDLKNSRSLQIPFAKALLSLDTLSFVTFRKWLQSLPVDYMKILVNHYKKVVVYIIKYLKEGLKYVSLTGTIEGDRNFMVSSLRVLDLLHKENKGCSGREMRLMYDEFYIPEIAENVDIRKDYFAWLAGGGRTFFGQNETVCFCEYSFLFDSQAKTLLLRADATRQMQGAINDAVAQMNPILWMLNPGNVQFLTLHVNRKTLVADALCQIDQYHYSELKKPLKIHFIGEEAEDAGGVRKEFFLLVLKELLNPDYGMFTEFEETRLIWFREGALEVDDMYSLIGTICGLAIYNFTIINLPFPLALYKKLLDEKVDLDDLGELDPTFTKSLRDLQEYEGMDVEDLFCLNFTITQDYFGETKVIPLKPDGEQIHVTSDNKLEYVNLMVNWRLNKAIEKQYSAFHKGFHRVCGGGVLKLFQPIELMDLVTGNENYDWKEFQKNTAYKGEYYPNHPTILLFWSVFDELSQEQKKKFLMFLTGCDRIPILGMKAIKMVIESTGDTSYLPVAHTCVSQLDLPKYSTKEKLKYKLLQAIQQSEGFGLV